MTKKPVVFLQRKINQVQQVAKKRLTLFLTIEVFDC